MDRNIANSLEWMKDPTRYFLSEEYLNISLRSDKCETKKIENTVEQYTDDIFDFSKKIAKAIVIAKQKGVLPDDIEIDVTNPENIAQLVTKGATLIDTIVKLAKGDIDTHQKLANRVLDTIHVWALSAIEFAVNKGIPIVEETVANVLETTGRGFGCPGVGKIVKLFINSFSPFIKNTVKSLLAAGCEKMNDFAKDAANWVIGKIWKKTKKPEGGIQTATQKEEDKEKEMVFA